MTALPLRDRVLALAAAGRLTPAQVAEAARLGWLPTTDANPAALTAAQTAATNRAALLAKVTPAIAANTTYLAIASPTVAQNTAQTKALTRQVNALLRIVGKALDATTGT